MNKIRLIDDNLLSELIEKETEFLPLMSDEDEAKISKESTPDVLPILPLRNTVLFPGVIIPITIGRDRWVKLIQDAEKGNKIIGVVSQKDFDTELPTIDDLNSVEFESLMPITFLAISAFELLKKIKVKIIISFFILFFS